MGRGGGYGGGAQDRASVHGDGWWEQVWLSEWEKRLDEGFALEANLKDAHISGSNQASKGLMRETPNPLDTAETHEGVYTCIYVYR